MVVYELRMMIYDSHRSVFIFGQSEVGQSEV